MSLDDTLHSLCGYGVILLKREGRLVIQSANHVLDEGHTTCLKQHKPLLLAILPQDAGYTPADVLDALEAYEERWAIMAESGVPSGQIEPVAVAQARSVLLSLPCAG